MIDQFRIKPQIVMYMKSLLRLCLSTPELLKDEKQSSLSDNCFATLNLLEFPHSDIFYNYIGELKQKVEETFDLTDLEYFYLHLVDYTNGGCMQEHSHDHNEDGKLTNCTLLIMAVHLAPRWLLCRFHLHLLLPHNDLI